MEKELSKTMKKKKLVIAISVFVLVVICAVTFLPVISVNVIFDRVVNEDEVATVFQGASFRSRLYYSVSHSAASLSVTSNSRLFGTPLDEFAVEAALSAEPRSVGIAVIDGSASLVDIIRVNNSPFVYDVVVYNRIFRRGRPWILPQSSQRFFENNPHARFWE